MTADLIELRQQFKPQTVQILFVTEAVQPGKRFFYKKNSNVFRAIKEACNRVFGEFESDDDFLSFFKENNCYVDYLCSELINDLPPAARQTARTNGIKPLSERLAELKPKVVITIMKVLEKEVNEATKLSAITSVEYTKAVSFPAHSQVNVDKCVQELKEIFQYLLENEIWVD